MKLSNYLCTFTSSIFLLLAFAGCNGELPAISDDAQWIDVRSAGEFSNGTAGDAINIPHNQIAEGIEPLNLPKDRQLVLFCRSGNRARTAVRKLTDLGYANLINLRTVGNAQKFLEESSASSAPTPE